MGSCLSPKTTDLSADCTPPDMIRLRIGDMA